MSSIKCIYTHLNSGKNINVEDMFFCNKPSNETNESYAIKHGFIFKNPSCKINKETKISPEEIAFNNSCIENKFNSDSWKKSKMRDRMHRLKMYSMKQESFINRNGEESIRTQFPAFNADEIESLLNKKRKRFNETGNPVYLHDWSCSIKNGCSESELRDTILDIRLAEQSYPEKKKYRSKTYYITDDEGFTTKYTKKSNTSTQRRNGKKSRSSRSSKKNKVQFDLFKTNNVVDLNDN